MTFWEGVKRNGGTRKYVASGSHSRRRCRSFARRCTRACARTSSPFIRLCMPRDDRRVDRKRELSRPPPLWFHGGGLTIDKRSRYNCNRRIGKTVAVQEGGSRGGDGRAVKQAIKKNNVI